MLQKSRKSLVNKLSQRLKLVIAFLPYKRDFPIRWFDMLNYLAKPPCTKIGPALIDQVEENGEYLAVKIHSVPTKLFWPKSLPIFDLYKVVTECFYEDDSHFYEVSETRVSPNDIVLDCGAAEGIFSLRVLERAKLIIAFEPSPIFVKSMKYTFASHLHKVSVQPYGLSDIETNAFLSGSSLYGMVVNSIDDGNIPIKNTTIDKWSDQSGVKVNFIKGDLESDEFKVLRGGAMTIKRDKPKIALTVYHPGNNWREILSFCRSIVPEYAYRIKGISYNNKRARPVMLHLWPE